jgi:hypothetical protein
MAKGLNSRSVTWILTRGLDIPLEQFDARDTLGRGVLSSQPTTNPTPNPTREDVSLLLDPGFTTKPYHTCDMA